MRIGTAHACDERWFPAELRCPSAIMATVERPTSRMFSSHAFTADLAAAEPLRRAALSTTVNVTAAIILIGVPQGSNHLLSPIFLGPILLASSFAGLFWRLSDALWRRIAIATIAPAIAKGDGGIEISAKYGFYEFGELVDANMLRPGFRLTRWRASGTYRETSFRLSALSAFQRRSKAGRAHLHYMICEIAVPVPFDGSVEIVPVRAGIGQFGSLRSILNAGAGLTKIPVGQPFGGHFEVWTDHPSSAKGLITPHFQANLIELAEHHPQSALRGRFADGWFTLVFPIKDQLLSDAGLTVPMHKLSGHGDAIMWELTIPRRLIDILHGDRPVRLF